MSVWKVPKGSQRSWDESPSTVAHPGSSSRGVRWLWRWMTSRAISMAALVAVAATVWLPLTSGQFSDNAITGSSDFTGSQLAAPATVTAQGGGGEIWINWTQSPTVWADGYEVLRSTSSGCCYTTIATINSLATTTYRDQTVVSGVSYYYVVRATHLSWRSPSSAEATGQALDNLIALYNFDDVTGTTVADTSGFGTPTDLTISDPTDVTWAAGSLTIDTNALISNPDSTKLVNAIQATGELTVEAWITPSNLTQGGPARVVTISSSTIVRDVTFGQEGDGLALRVNTSLNGDNGLPQLDDLGGLDSLRLFHVVGTRDAAGWLHIYIDGALVESRLDGGDLSTWASAGLSVAIANEMTEDRPWLGTYYKVAFFDQALSDSEIAGLYSLGH